MMAAVEKGGIWVKRAEQTEQTRARIVHSATVTFGELGYEAASISRISAHAGISKGIIYHYFQDKDALYLSCTAACFERLAGFLREGLRNEPEEEQAVREFILLRRAFFVQHPEYLTIFYEALFGRPPHLREQFRQLRAPIDAVNLEFCRTCMRNSGEPLSEEEMLTFFTMLQEGVLMQLATEPPATVSPQAVFASEQHVIRFLSIFFRGLRETSGRRDSV